MRLLLAALALLVLAPAAHAQDKPWIILAHIGFNGSSEADKIKVKGQGEAELDDDDIKSDFGASGIYDVAVSDNIRVGGRLGVFTGKGDDVDADILTADIGGSLRIFFNEGRWRGFALLGLGATYASFDIDDRIEAKFTGFGWHMLLGPAIQGPLTGGIDFVGAIVYERQAVSELDSDGNVKPYGVKATLEDNVLSHILISAGVGF